MYNKSVSIESSSKVCCKKEYDKLNEEEYVKLKLDYERSKKELEDVNVRTTIDEINSIVSKESLSVEDYNKVFRLKRRLARTDLFANQYYDWFKKNIGLGISIYDASCKNDEYYYPVVTYGEGLAKGMYLDFRDTFLRLMKKSEYYNDYAYTVRDLKSNDVVTIKFKEIIEDINNFIEELNGELDFTFKYKEQEIVYPIFEKVDYLVYKGDIYNCRLVLNEDIAEYLRDIIDAKATIESNIEYISTVNEAGYASFDNVISFNAKR